MKHNSLNHDLPDEKDFKMKAENNQVNQENPKNHGSDNLNSI